MGPKQIMRCSGNIAFYRTIEFVVAFIVMKGVLIFSLIGKFLVHKTNAITLNLKNMIC